MDTAARKTMASVTALPPLIALIAESCSEKISEPAQRQAMPMRLLRVDVERAEDTESLIADSRDPYDASGRHKSPLLGHRAPTRTFLIGPQAEIFQHQGRSGQRCDFRVVIRW